MYFRVRARKNTMQIKYTINTYFATIYKNTNKTYDL